MASKREHVATSWLPDEARIVAVVIDDPAGLYPAVLELAAGVGEQRRRTLVVGVGGPGHAMDEGLGTVDAPGLSDLLAGRASLTDLVYRVSHGRFLYLPPGGAEQASAASPSTAPASPPLPRSAMRALIERVRAAGGTLLFVAPRDRAGLPVEWFDVEVEIGAASASIEPTVGPASATPLSAGSSVDVREERPSTRERHGSGEERGVDRAGAAAETVRWRRHRMSRSTPVARIGLAAAALVVLLGGWWLLARFITAQAAGPGDRQDLAVPVQTAPGRPTSQAAGPAGPSAAVSEARSDATRTDAEEPAALVAESGGVELRYSVLVASYLTLADALQHLRRIDDNDVLLLIAPTPVRGRTYYRLFAGALPTRERATELMEKLEQSGIKDRSSDWDVRPASLGYRISLHDDAAAARAAEVKLLEHGIPAYSLPLVADGDTVHQVYAGAYERPEAAVVMRTILSEAGVEARLVPRRGEPR